MGVIFKVCFGFLVFYYGFHQKSQGQVYYNYDSSAKYQIISNGWGDSISFKTDSIKIPDEQTIRSFYEKYDTRADSYISIIDSLPNVKGDYSHFNAIIYKNYLFSPIYINDKTIPMIERFKLGHVLRNLLFIKKIEQEISYDSSILIPHPIFWGETLPADSCKAIYRPFFFNDHPDFVMKYRNFLNEHFLAFYEGISNYIVKDIKRKYGENSFVVNTLNHYYCTLLSAERDPFISTRKMRKDLGYPCN